MHTICIPPPPIRCFLCAYPTPVLLCDLIYPAYTLHMVIIFPDKHVPESDGAYKPYTHYYDESAGPQTVNSNMDPCQVYGSSAPIPDWGPIYGQTMRMTDWMGCLPDEAPIGSISIPGTHNSLARHGGPTLQFQSWDIPTQLRAGIRYFDLRLRLLGAEVIFYNGPQEAPTLVKEFMDAVSEFLREHPREMILAQISNEAEGPAGNPEFYYQLHKTLNDSHGSMIFPLQIPNVRLGMARGKMVIVKAYSGGPPGGVEYNMMQKVGETTLSRPDDKNAKAMMKPIKNHFKKAMQSGDFEKMFLAVVSACGPGFPYQYAAVINERLYFYLARCTKGRVGIITMDFPAQEIISSIVLRNFKPQK